MKKIAKFEKEDVQNLRNEIDKALRDVAEKYGISIKAGNATFTANLVTIKVDMATMSESGEATDKYAEIFKQIAPQLGLKKEDLNREFTYSGKVFILKGYNHKARKFGFIAFNKADGLTYKLPDDGVITALKA